MVKQYRIYYLDVYELFTLDKDCKSHCYLSTFVSWVCMFWEISNNTIESDKSELRKKTWGPSVPLKLEKWM